MHDSKKDVISWKRNAAILAPALITIYIEAQAINTQSHYRTRSLATRVHTGLRLRMMIETCTETTNTAALGAALAAPGTTRTDYKDRNAGSLSRLKRQEWLLRSDGSKRRGFNYSIRSLERQKEKKETAACCRFRHQLRWRRGMGPY